MQITLNFYNAVRQLYLNKTREKINDHYEEKRVTCSSAFHFAGYHPQSWLFRRLGVWALSLYF